MTAKIIEIAAWRSASRPLVKTQCDAVTLAEAVATQQLRWACALCRDWLRWAWGV